MASKYKSFEDVCSSKVCKKSFRDVECQANIKIHCDSCDQFQSAKRRKLGKLRISNFFVPIPSDNWQVNALPSESRNAEEVDILCEKNISENENVANLIILELMNQSKPLILLMITLRYLELKLRLIYSLTKSNRLNRSRNI